MLGPPETGDLVKGEEKAILSFVGQEMKGKMSQGKKKRNPR